MQGSGEAGAEGAAQRVRSTPDWGQTSVIGDHLWSPSNASGDFCYVGEGDCTVSQLFTQFYTQDLHITCNGVRWTLQLVSKTHRYVIIRNDPAWN